MNSAARKAPARGWSNARNAARCASAVRRADIAASSRRRSPATFRSSTATWRWRRAAAARPANTRPEERAAVARRCSPTSRRSAAISPAGSRTSTRRSSATGRRDATSSRCSRRRRCCRGCARGQSPMPRRKQMRRPPEMSRADTIRHRSSKPLPRCRCARAGDGSWGFCTRTNRPARAPVYRLAGRDKLIYLDRLIEALPCPSKSSAPATRKRRTSTSGGRTSASQLIRAAELTGDRSLVPSSSDMRKQSSGENTRPRKPQLVVSNPRS